MRICFPLTVVALLTTSAVRAQMDLPGNPTVTPKTFKTRAVGGGLDPGATVDPGEKANPKVRYVTHIVLFDSRFWTSVDGKPLEAKLIAFEDLVAEAPKGSAEPVMPAPPAHPTVVRNGRIRLLVNKKPVEVALDKLSRQDQEFVDQIKAALAKKAEEK
ncbi:MAG: hypothetical protein ABIS50_15575 [Luteolibacter sp.]|uniref:hypothetical protein n=1 Tax=Luteolibacter sp. TaxID=1962973 RepID=UPI0032678BE1